MTLNELYEVIDDKNKIMLTDGNRVLTNDYMKNLINPQEDDYCFANEIVTDVRVFGGVLKIDIEASEEYYDWYRKTKYHGTPVQSRRKNKYD